MFRFELSLFVAFWLTVFLVQGQQNYCDKSLCGNLKHIACNNSGAWASTCPTFPKPELVKMTQPQWQFILHAHNAKRNSIAQGRVDNCPPARKMAIMRWSPEMANLTELTLLQCQLKRDACRNTPKFRNSGQSMGQWIVVKSRSTEEAVNVIIDAWWSGKQFANPGVIDSYPRSWPGPAINQFGLMIKQDNVAVGCAMVKFWKFFELYFILACNYATELTPGKAVYVKGPTASGCTTGTSVNYAGLCSAAETYV